MRGRHNDNSERSEVMFGSLSRFSMAVVAAVVVDVEAKGVLPGLLVNM